MTLAASTAQTPVAVKATKTVSIPLTSVAANSLVALFVLSDSDNGSATESLSIGTTAGLTWTRNVQANGSPGACCAVFTAPFPAGGSITPTVTDSEAMSPANSEMAIVPVIFTDTNGSIPGTGATATSNGTTAYTSTVNNSWGWGLGLGQGVDNATQTRIYINLSFDDGDQVNVAQRVATTPTAGTSVSMDLGGLHTAIIEITPGSGGTTINGTGTATGAGVVTSAVSILSPGTPSGLGSVTANAVLRSIGTGTGLGVVTPAATLLAPGTATGLGTVTGLVTQRSSGSPTGAGVVLNALTILAPGFATGAGVATGQSGGGGTTTGTGSAVGAGIVTALATLIPTATPTGVGVATGAVTFRPAPATATGLGTAINATVQILSSGMAVGAGTAVNASVRIIAIGHATGAGVATGSRKTTVSGVSWEITEPQAVWSIVMLDTRRSIMSDGFVRFRIARQHQGQIYDPTGATVSVAYLPAWGNPGPSDFHTAAWSSNYIGGYVAYSDPGPSGANLQRGTYFVWVKIVDNVLGETPVAQVGRLIVQ